MAVHKVSLYYARATRALTERSDFALSCFTNRFQRTASDERLLNVYSGQPLLSLRLRLQDQRIAVPLEAQSGKCLRRKYVVVFKRTRTDKRWQNCMNSHAVLSPFICPCAFHVFLNLYCRACVLAGQMLHTMTVRFSAAGQFVTAWFCYRRQASC